MSEELKVWEKKSTWGILFGILCVVIVGLVVAIIVVKNNNIANKPNPDEETFLENGEFSEEPEGLSTEDYLVEMNKRIEATDSAEEKAKLHTFIAGTLYNKQLNGEGDFVSQILENAYAAEDEYPTERTAYNIYSYEDELGDKTKAEEYLEKAKERVMEIGGELRG